MFGQRVSQRHIGVPGKTGACIGRVQKPRTLRLTMCGNHDEVRAWLRENA